MTVQAVLATKLPVLLDAMLSLPAPTAGMAKFKSAHRVTTAKEKQKTKRLAAKASTQHHQGPFHASTALPANTQHSMRLSNVQNAAMVPTNLNPNPQVAFRFNSATTVPGSPHKSFVQLRKPAVVEVPPANPAMQEPFKTSPVKLHAVLVPMDGATWVLAPPDATPSHPDRTLRMESNKCVKVDTRVPAKINPWYPAPKEPTTTLLVPFLAFLAHPAAFPARRVVLNVLYVPRATCNLYQKHPSATLSKLEK